MALTGSVPAWADSFFTPGNVVVSVEGNGPQTPGVTYTDNQAAPLSLYQFTPNSANPTTAPAAQGSTLVLPQQNVGNNYAVSGEYGSSSEADLQLSGNGEYLTIMGYGVNAQTYNSNPGQYNSSAQAGNTALGQSNSVPGQSTIAVPRVAVLVDSDGTVNSATAVYNVFNANNPRSAYTQSGTQIYISGQGTKGDTTGGVFLVQAGATTTTPTAITGSDATYKSAPGDYQDTRSVQIYNNTLYVSTDTGTGSPNRSYIGTVGTPGTPPTSYTGGSGPVQLTGFGSQADGLYTLNGSNGNSINKSTGTVNLAPEDYFFANSTTLYVADDGEPKNTDKNASTDGGLQKWTYTAASGWQLDYTITTGLLNFISSSSSGDGTTGLFGLTGEVVGGNVELFATNYTNTDLGQTYLYGLSDCLSCKSESQVSSESFSVLATAPADTNFKGVSFAPVPEPSSCALFGFGLVGIFVFGRRLRTRV